MADQTSTLTSPQPRKEVKRNQALAASLFNDTVGFFEQSAELLIRGGGDYVNQEGPVRGPAEQVRLMGEHEIGKDRPPERLDIGGRTEIPFNNPDHARYQQIIEGINVKVEEVSEANKILNQSVREVAGMDDEQLAETERFNNEGYRGETLRSRFGLLEAVKNYFQDLWDKAKKLTERFNPFQTHSKRVSSKGAVSGAATPEDNKALYHQNAVDGQGIVTGTHGAG